MSNIGDFLWIFFVSFFFIIYFFIFVSIITDLFRDHTSSGWTKALWVLLLIVLPFLGAFIYLVVRGGGMAKRQAEAIQAVKDAQDSYIKEVAGTSHADELAKAADLKKTGALTDAEYEQLKAKILAS
jgi:uncharacterized membrane protein